MDARDFTTVQAAVQHDDTDLNEMANLPKEDTGIEGIVYISTMESGHGPRVKWFPNRPQRDAPCLYVSIGAVPEVRNLNLPPRIADAAAPDVEAWVGLNHTALLSFWNEGHSWTRQEATAFLDRLVRWTGR